MVREFKGKLYVDIREMYYDKDGDMKPGKKGDNQDKIYRLKYSNIMQDSCCN